MHCCRERGHDLPAYREVHSCSEPAGMFQYGVTCFDRDRFGECPMKYSAFSVLILLGAVTATLGQSEETAVPRLGRQEALAKAEDERRQMVLQLLQNRIKRLAEIEPA